MDIYYDDIWSLRKRKSFLFSDELELQYINKVKMVKMCMPFPAVVKKRLEELIHYDSGNLEFK